MTHLVLRLSAVLALLAAWLSAANAGTPADALNADPYDYHARQQLVRAYQDAGDWTSAYYQAAWLAWFAPRRFADSPTGALLLRDRRARDQAAAWAASGQVAAVIAAADAARTVANTCLNGAVTTQASRLRDEVTGLISTAEQADSKLARPDPVARAALARLYLSLDDCLALDNTADSQRARPKALQKAASLASAVVGWLPKSPGAHLTLAIARARLAGLDNRAEFWDMAIEECRMAEALDPYDHALIGMIWTLYLRAGKWAEAKRWETGGPPTSDQNLPQKKRRPSKRQ